VTIEGKGSLPFAKALLMLTDNSLSGGSRRKSKRKICTRRYRAKRVIHKTKKRA
jgi:hypothetical protein